MPDSKGKIMWDFIEAGVVAIAGVFGLREMAARAAAKAIEPFVKPLTEDIRGEIAADLLAMPESDKSNLERRIKEACANHTENRVIFLLSKLPTEAPQGRRPSFKRMNDLDDDHFMIYLGILEHDTFTQWMKKFADRDGDGKIGKGDIEELKGILMGILTPIGKGLGKATRVIVAGIGDGARALDEAAENAAPLVDRLTAWFEERTR